MLKRVYEYFWEAFHIFFRHYNFPCELGLIKVGNPDSSSPVFLSGNYTLTVRRLLRVLAGTDCYLLVANARGSNVWCAAGMNEFSEHDVIDAITVAGLSGLVKHRKVIAPPYAAPGVDTRAVRARTGFTIVWGPTHLDDIPRYITNGYKRTNDMIQVQFGFQDRMEQALSTSLAYSMTIGLLAIFWPRYILGVIALIWIVYCFSFSLWYVFPVERWRVHTLSIAVVLSAALSAFGLWRGWSAYDFWVWEPTLLVVVTLMALDACGSTAIYKTTLRHWIEEGNYQSLFDPVIDPARCTNCMACVLVCPKDVFAGLRSTPKKVVSVKPDECIECLACVKQCYDDAIYNRSGRYKGDVKSIANLHHLMTRDWRHLEVEDRWIGAPTRLRNGLPVIADDAARLAAGSGAHPGPPRAVDKGSGRLVIATRAIRAAPVREDAARDEGE